MDPEFERRAQVESTPNEQSGLGVLCGVEFVLRAVVATATFGRVRTQAWIAQFFAPERPVDEVAQGRILGPLPGEKFGSRSSWNEASRASMAALTATAW